MVAYTREGKREGGDRTDKRRDREGGRERASKKHACGGKVGCSGVRLSEPSSFRPEACPRPATAP